MLAHSLPVRAPAHVLRASFDPLDGSSNIDVNISIGTIYAIYKADKPAAELTEADLKRPGNELIASGYWCAVLAA